MLVMKLSLCLWAGAEAVAPPGLGSLRGASQVLATEALGLGVAIAWVAICTGCGLHDSRSAWGAFLHGARSASGVLHRLWSRSGGMLWYRVQVRGVGG
jgi:hypothetical protein